MDKLTMERAKELLKTTTTQPNLFQHALAVSCTMGAMAKHFGGDVEYWEAIGYLHDYDYQEYPEEHLKHTEKPLRDAELDDESIRAILSHGWGICTDIEPLSDMEKSLYTVDALSGLISATAKMRPNGVMDLTSSSVVKKLKDKSFASGVNRETISQGVEMLGMDRADIITICIEGMKPYAANLEIGAKV